MSVLGYHSERLTPEAVALIQASRPVVCVTLDLSRDRLAAIRPYVGLLVARFDPGGDTQDTYLGRGADLGRTILAGVQPIVHFCDMVAVLNEPDVSTVAAATLVARTLVDACAVLRAAGMRTVGPNCSTGTPALPGDPGGPAILDALLPGVEAVDIVGMHEYSHPSMRDGAGYLIGRTSTLLDYWESKGLRKDAILTECGIDFDLPGGQPSGYRANGVADAAYLADLQWASGVWAADPRIRGAALFECGAYGRFASFDVTGTPLGGMLAAWLRGQSSNSAPTSSNSTPTSPSSARQGAAVTGGIDVSGNQGVIDWPKVAAQEQFAVIKAAEGVGWQDPRFIANWQGAKDAGLLRSAYSFARFDLGNRGADEARYLLSVAGAAPGDLPPVLDLEVGPPGPPVDLSPQARDWFAVIDAAWGEPAPLYSYAWFLQAYNLTEATVGKRQLYLAAYQSAPPTVPPGWPDGVIIWQDTDAATVAGIVGPVDGDVTNLTLDQLRALGKAAPQAAASLTGGVQEVLTITPAILAAARARLGALGGRLVAGGAIENELVARYALGTANPQLGTQIPTPVVGSETGLPTGESYAALDSGEILGAKAPTWAPFNPEEKDRAAIIAACGWPLR